MRERRRRSAAGFTLVEALCAGVLLALVVATLGTTVSQAARLRGYAADTQRAAELLDLLLTRVDLIGPARLRYEGPTEGTIADRFHWRADVERRLEGDLYEVTLRLSWDRLGGRRTVEAHTLLNDRPGSRNPLLAWEDL